MAGGWAGDRRLRSNSEFVPLARFCTGASEPTGCTLNALMPYTVWSQCGLSGAVLRGTRARRRLGLMLLRYG